MCVPKETIENPDRKYPAQVYFHGGASWRYHKPNFTILQDINLNTSKSRSFYS